MYLEARRIDQNEKKIARERENLLRLLSTRDMYGSGGPASAGLAGQVAGAGGSGTGIIIPSNSITIPSSSPSNNNNSINGPLSPSVAKSPTVAIGAQNIPAKKRKKAPKGSNQAEDATGVPGSSSSHTKLSSSNRRPSTSSSVNDITLPQGVQIKKEKLTPGAYLRSQKMTPIVSTKQQRVQTTLSQLGQPLKPTMPTATVMGKWDQLTNNIVTLLDLKKQVDKLEADLKVVKMRRGSASGSGLFPGSTGSASGAGGTGPGTGSAGGLGSDGNFGVKREGTADETGTPGQVKKKKRKE